MRATAANNNDWQLDRIIQERCATASGVAKDDKQWGKRALSHEHVDM